MVQIKTVYRNLETLPRSVNGVICTKIPEAESQVPATVHHGQQVDRQSAQSWRSHPTGLQAPERTRRPDAVAGAHRPRGTRTVERVAEKHRLRAEKSHQRRSPADVRILRGFAAIGIRRSVFILFQSRLISCFEEIILAMLQLLKTRIDR